MERGYQCSTESRQGKTIFNSLVGCSSRCAASFSLLIVSLPGVPGDWLAVFFSSWVVLFFLFPSSGRGKPGKNMVLLGFAGNVLDLSGLRHCDYIGNNLINQMQIESKI